MFKWVSGEGRGSVGDSRQWGMGGASVFWGEWSIDRSASFRLVGRGVGGVGVRVGVRTGFGVMGVEEVVGGGGRVGGSKSSKVVM